MNGRVVTFYSYKGGVGRSFALANIAVVLAQWGLNVLMVDWDIEAPGLDHYFRRLSRPKAGVLDFLSDCKAGQQRPWNAYATLVDDGLWNGRLFLMPAWAQSEADYAAQVQELDWDELYGEYALGARLEALRAEWIEHFDFVLVDSRTGVTDFSGLTTAQLPDILAFMFTANEQSLMGCADIARRAMEARRIMPVDRPALLPLPIPARFEQREEYEMAQQWRMRFDNVLQPFFETWVPIGCDTLKLIDLLTIPYVPRWTFGEDLATLLEPAGTSGVRSPSHPASYACETLAALFVHGFAKIELLTSSRDEFVHGARGQTHERELIRQARTAHVFLSYDRTEMSTNDGVIDRFYEYLSTIDVLVSMGNENSGSSVTISLIEQADAFIVFVGEFLNKSPWQRDEVDWILRQSLRSDRPKPIIPIILAGGEEAFFSSKLSSFHAISIEHGMVSDALHECAPASIGI